MLFHLPTELILEVGAYLEAEKDINSLCQTSRRLYSILNPHLYRINSRSSPSALTWAVLCGIESTARISIENGAEVGWKDLGGYGLLTLATQRSHIEIIRLLLQTGKVDVDLKDNGGRTPLSWAAEFGEEGVVELLLGTGSVDVNLKDNQGRTPLSWAAENGNEGVVKLLLETGRVDIDSRDHEGRTPLSRAAEFFQKETVKVLLETGKSNVNSTDDEGRTPLWWARDPSRFDSVFDSFDAMFDSEDKDQKEVVKLLRRVRDAIIE